jgi:hypothetical protein
LRVYIAGPMTGKPGFNYPAFHHVAKCLREVGHEVHNPAEHFGGDQTLSYATYLRAAVTALLACEAIFTLPGWMYSRGAKLEFLIAKTLGMVHLNPTRFDRLCTIDTFITAKPTSTTDTTNPSSPQEPAR